MAVTQVAVVLKNGRSSRLETRRLPKATLFAITLVFGLLSFLQNLTGIHAQVYGPRDVFVEDLKIIVRGQEYFVKGIAYNPFPLGVKSMDETGYGGGGYCSPKSTVFGEYLSACFGSDMFDGVPADPLRDPPGPREGWWKAVWERDFAVMRRAGINTLRIYNMNPLTSEFLNKYPNEFGGVVDVDQGAQHLPFLDYAFINGFRVIVPVVSDESMLTNYGEQRLKKITESTVDELGNHPALLMWSVGNELDLADRKELRDRVNMLMVYAREYTQTKWDRTVPVTTVLLDIPKDYETLTQEMDVDLFVSNAGYRHLDFDPLWDGEAESGFSGFASICKKTGKPLLFGEIGMHNQSIATTETPDWFNQQWKMVLDRVGDGCTGAVFFEYSDEPYTKRESESDMGIVSFKEAKNSAGKGSMDENVWLPDLIVEKDIVFDSVVSGHPSSQYKEYNFNTDVFTLIGRDPYQSPNYQYDDNDDFEPISGQSERPPGDGRSSANPVFSSQTLTVICTTLLIITLMARLL